MKKASFTYPSTGLSKRRIEDSEVGNAVQEVMSIIENIRIHLADIINFNSISYISQNAQPTTLTDGQMMVWKDADATTGNPTHYILSLIHI